MKPNPDILIVIQARSGSSRLPGKVFLPLKDRPLLLRMYERIQFSKTPKKVIIATTTKSEDDQIAVLCEKNEIEYYRGHQTDLLDRHYKAGIEYGADIVVKIPSDCPLICPDVIDKVLNFFISNKNKFDFVSNLHPQSYPDGNDVEVIPMKILETAYNEASKQYEREHTTPFIWENKNRFRIGNVLWETGLDYSNKYRFTIDYEEDYELIKSIYDELYDKKNDFKLPDILRLLEQKPELEKVNEKYLGENWYNRKIYNEG